MEKGASFPEVAPLEVGGEEGVGIGESPAGQFVEQAAGLVEEAELGVRVEEGIAEVGMGEKAQLEEVGVDGDGRR